MAQGTIKHFDLESVDGSLLMDDGTEVAIDAPSLEGSASSPSASASGSRSIWTTPTAGRWPVGSASVTF